MKELIFDASGSLKESARRAISSKQRKDENKPLEMTWWATKVLSATRVTRRLTMAMSVSVCSNLLTSELLVVFISKFSGLHDRGIRDDDPFTLVDQTRFKKYMNQATGKIDSLS